MKIKLYNTEISTRMETCGFLGRKPIKIDEPYLNMYTMFKGCNAKCEFCSYMDKAKKFNIDKYKEVLEYVVKNVKLKKFNLTGGEPTLNYDLFKEVYDITNSLLDKRTELTINTNGINLHKLVEDKSISDRVNCISLSRHHYLNESNNDIFGVDLITNEEIKSLQKKMKKKDTITISCNLIKGYIDSKGEVHKFLDLVADMGIEVVGFVSLMSINEYCEDNFINFNRLGLKSKLFTMTKEFKHKDICRCNNYMYISEKYDKIIRVYYKNTYKPEFTTGIISFDGENLVNGFSDEIIH